MMLLIYGLLGEEDCDPTDDNNYNTRSLLREDTLTSLHSGLRTLGTVIRYLDIDMRIVDISVNL